MIREDTEIREMAYIYAKSVGANIKLKGDYAWVSPNYNDWTKRGRLVRLIGTIKGKVIVYDNKKGRISIGNYGRY